MIELFQIYFFAFILCPLASGLLAIQGAHLVARKEGLQLLALAQAGLFGNILGELLFHGSHLGPFVMSLFFYLALKLFFIFSQKFNESLYIVIYFIFVSLGYLFISLFPSLDSHLAVGLFGDIVSLSQLKSQILSAFFLVLLVVAYFFHRFFIKSTINRSLMHNVRVDWWEESFFILGLLLSLYGLGLLFTLSFSLFPVVLIGREGKNLRRSLVAMGVLAGVASNIGLSMSILSSRIPTVPGQVLVLLAIFLLVKGLYSFRN